jgi:hypothetical protein
MALNARVAEQLAELGIDIVDVAPDPEVMPESNDLTWDNQIRYLDRVCSESEKQALGSLIHPDRVQATAHLAGVPDDRLEEIFAKYQDYLDDIVEHAWPRKEDT